jgi:tetratricopeptide (TPR) repeat protein
MATSRPSLALIAAIGLVCFTAAAPSGAQSAARDAGATLRFLFDAYDEGRYAAVDDTLRSGPTTPLARLFKSEANRWIAAGSSEQRDRRRLVAASVGLEVLATGLSFEWRNTYTLVEDACELVRQLPRGTRAESAWHHLSVALLQGGTAGSFVGQTMQDHIRIHGRDRVSPSPHLELAWALEVDRSTPLQPRSFGSMRQPILDEPPSRDAVRRAAGAIAQYTELLNDPVVGAEARLLIGNLYTRLHQHEQAHTHLSAVRASSDPYLKHLASFLAGQIHRRSGDHASAAVSFQQALRDWPGAMSASLLLADTLSQVGRWDEAHAVATAAAAQDARLDPWRVMAHGGFRRWPHWQSTLREAVRR